MMGSSFRATDDHLIMLKDGSYRQVKDLQVGDSLNPFHSQVKQLHDSRTKRRYVYDGQQWAGTDLQAQNVERGASVSGESVAGALLTRCCPACRQNFVTAQEAQIFCGLVCRNSPLGMGMMGTMNGETRTENAPTGEQFERVCCLKASRLLMDAGIEPTLAAWNGLRESGANPRRGARSASGDDGAVLCLRRRSARTYRAVQPQSCFRRFRRQ